MSGGSLNYLGTAELTQNEQNVAEAAEKLESLGHKNAALRTRHVLYLFEQIHGLQEELKEVWRTLDRYGSGDDAAEEVAKDVAAWEVGRYGCA